MDAAPLVFADVTKRYGGVEALRSFSAQLREGEIYGLLGPNGAGKTTAVKLGVGLLTPDAGEVRLEGEDVRAPEAGTEARIGYLPDEPLLYPKLTGRETLDLVAALRGVSDEQLGAILSQEADPLRLGEEELSRFVGTYSHGMKRKLLFLMARLHDPDIYVLDEPTQALDALAARAMKEELSRIRDRRGTVLLATNDLGVAGSLCDRIGILDRGELRYEGTREQVRERYPEAMQDLERLFLEQVTGTEGREGRGTAGS